MRDRHWLEETRQMIIQTRRPKGFAAVLRGEVIGIDTLVDGHIPLWCRGTKRETGEPYAFRVLLTEAELEAIARSRPAKRRA